MARRGVKWMYEGWRPSVGGLSGMRRDEAMCPRRQHICMRAQVVDKRGRLRLLGLAGELGVVRYQFDRVSQLGFIADYHAHSILWGRASPLSAAANHDSDIPPLLRSCIQSTEHGKHIRPKEGGGGGGGGGGGDRGAAMAYSLSWVREGMEADGQHCDLPSLFLRESGHRSLQVGNVGIVRRTR